MKANVLFSSSLLNSCSTTFSKIGIVVELILLLSAIIVINVYIIQKEIKKRHTSTAFYFTLTTLLTCILMVPTATKLHQLFELETQKHIIKTEQNNIKALQLEVQNQELTKQKLALENALATKNLQMATLNEQLSLLKHSQISFNRFQDIMEMALLRTNILQTKVYKERVSDIYKGKGIFADQYFDEALIINLHDIDAKFGINLQAIKIKKTDERSIEISGIEPIYIGATKNNTNTIISEMRKVNKKYSDPRAKNKSHELDDSQFYTASVEVKNTAASKARLAQLAKQQDEYYQASLAQMENFSSLEDAVIIQAQNLLLIVFSPVYSTISFTKEADPEGISIKEFFQNELNQNELKTNESLALQHEIAELKAQLEALD